MPELYNEEVIIIPSEGQLKALEKQNLEINFIPLYKKKYKLEVPITLTSNTQPHVIGYHAPGSANKDTKYQLETSESVIRISGQGSDGAIEFHPNFIDFEEVKVNFSKKVVYFCHNIRCMSP